MERDGKFANCPVSFHPHFALHSCVARRGSMPAFEVLEGFPKGCGGDVLAMEWCPTMDLIALITSDSQILVHRVTWQRLFVISVDEQPVRCLAWRPDGKQLAAGHADGSVTLYDVEDGELLSCHREHSSPLCLFSWVEAVPAGEQPALVPGGLRTPPTPPTPPAPPPPPSLPCTTSFTPSLRLQAPARPLPPRKARPPASRRTWVAWRTSSRRCRSCPSRRRRSSC